MANKLLRFLEDPDAVNYFPIPVGQDILNKERGVKQYVAYMLDRTNTMFEYENLPPTIPSYILELYLQVFGYAAFVEVADTNPIRSAGSETVTPPGVYIFFGGVGGERDIYYRPKLFTAANPRLKGSIQSTILYPGDAPTSTSTPCVLMANDRNYVGLLPLFNRYAQQLTENDISIRSAQINARAQIGISCSTDRDKESARKYLDDLEAGKLGIIGETAFLEGISISNVSPQSSNHIIQLIELQQYLKASWFNELGLNVNFNMKREYMSEEEIAVNTDILLPLVDDMFRCREEAIDLINTVFNLNIKVRKSSAWANKELEDLAAMAESAASGGIAVPDHIMDKSGGDYVEAQKENPDSSQASPETQIHTSVSSSSVNQTDGRGSDSEAGSSGTSVEEVGGDDSARTPDVIVNLTIQSEGGEQNIELAVPQSEALEESEESDSESSVS